MPELLANSITVERPILSLSLFQQPKLLQQYITRLHQSQDLDIVITGREKLIIADVVEDNINTEFSHDLKGEIRKTIRDRKPRSFVETSDDYPEGIDIRPTAKVRI